MKIEEDNHVKWLAEQLYEHQTTGRFTDIRLVCSNGSVLGKFLCVSFQIEAGMEWIYSFK